MNDELKRLIAVQHTLNGVLDLCQVAAAGCDEVGAKGLAMATYMLGEAVAVFSQELNSYVLGGNSNESVDSL